MTARSAQRLCIRLDPAMLLEGLLLERLSRVPKARRQEWLRGLLVQGYLWEGRTHRGLQRNAQTQDFAGDQAENEAPAPGLAFASWPTRPKAAMPQDAPEDSLPPRAVPTTPNKPTASKTFAHLRKVIG